MSPFRSEFFRERSRSKLQSLVLQSSTVITKHRRLSSIANNVSRMRPAQYLTRDFQIAFHCTAWSFRTAEGRCFSKGHRLRWSTRRSVTTLRELERRLWFQTDLALQSRTVALPTTTPFKTEGHYLLTDRPRLPSS